MNPEKEQFFILNHNITFHERKSATHSLMRAKIFTAKCVFTSHTEKQNSANKNVNSAK